MATQGERHDLLIAGGRLLDPGQGLDGLMDVAVSDGRIVRIESDMAGAAAHRVLDAAGLLVVPGLVDLHTHVAAGLGALPADPHAITPDVAGVFSGVTTVVDAGTAGAANAAGFVNHVAADAKTRVIGFLNAGKRGILHAPEVREPADMDVAAAVAAIRARPDVLRGIKVRMLSPLIVELGMELPRAAAAMAREAGVPLMAHVGDIYGDHPIAAELTPRLLGEVLAPGDIVAHACSAHVGALLSGRELLPEAPAARERGVLFDAAVGRANFDFEAARAVLDQGLIPDIISTDMVGVARFDLVHSLTECMGKFLALGLSLEDVVRMTTSAPAQALGMQDEIGALKPGRVADISILEAVEGDWVFRDMAGGSRRGRVALRPRAAVRAGSVVPLDYGPRPWGWLPESAATAGETM
ncbi:MAG: amidohydrolase family protein [Gemmatimonadetes bacterium]|nr:amidohydrolase family protein [Gemmatimonadota bacterium]